MLAGDVDSDLPGRRAKEENRAFGRLDIGRTVRPRQKADEDGIANQPVALEPPDRAREKLDLLLRLPQLLGNPGDVGESAEEDEDGPSRFLVTEGQLGSHVPGLLLVIDRMESDPLFRPDSSPYRLVLLIS